MLLKRLIKLITRILYRPLLMRYLGRDRHFSHHGIRILVKKGVFHPGLFFSTRFLLDELSKEKLTGKSLLEVGAGSGLISFVCARQGANVTATDISSAAIEGLRHNKAAVGITDQHLRIVRSDLFRELTPQRFDYIIINPPYYAQDPVNEEQRAWYCGKDHVYFQELFAQIPQWIRPGTQVWMSLSDDCDLLAIRRLAEAHRVSMTLKKEKMALRTREQIYLLDIAR